MKKLNKIMAIACAITTLSFSSGICGINNVNAYENHNSEIMPMYVAISYTYSAIQWDGWGRVRCNGATEVLPGYRAAVDVELQKKLGSVWTPIKTWSSSDWDYSSIEKYWYVETGYEYRVKTTHYSYDSNGNQLEKVTKYSNTVS